MSDSLQHHEPQHTRPPCPSPTPGACSNPCSSSWWCHPTSITPFSCVQSFPTSGSFPMSPLFASGSQSIGASALASVRPVNIQDWFPLGLPGPRDSRESSPAPRFKSINSSACWTIWDTSQGQRSLNPMSAMRWVCLRPAPQYIFVK